MLCREIRLDTHRSTSSSFAFPSESPVVSLGSFFPSRSTNGRSNFFFGVFFLQPEKGSGKRERSFSSQHQLRNTWSLPMMSHVQEHGFLGLPGKIISEVHTISRAYTNNCRRRKSPSRGLPVSSLHQLLRPRLIGPPITEVTSPPIATKSPSTTRDIEAIGIVRGLESVEENGRSIVRPNEMRNNEMWSLPANLRAHRNPS